MISVTVKLDISLDDLNICLKVWSTHPYVSLDRLINIKDITTLITKNKPHTTKNTILIINKFSTKQKLMDRTK